jgi:hypothetical protein
MMRFMGEPPFLIVHNYTPAGVINASQFRGKVAAGKSINERRCSGCFPIAGIIRQPAQTGNSPMGENPCLSAEGMG